MSPSDSSKSSLCKLKIPPYSHHHTSTSLAFTCTTRALPPRFVGAGVRLPGADVSTTETSTGGGAVSSGALREKRGKESFQPRPFFDGDGLPFFGGSEATAAVATSFVAASKFGGAAWGESAARAACGWWDGDLILRSFLGPGTVGTGWVYLATAGGSSSELAGLAHAPPPVLTSCPICLEDFAVDLPHPDHCSPSPRERWRCPNPRLAHFVCLTCDADYQSRANNRCPECRADP